MASNWFTRMFTPSKSNGMTGEQWNAAYNYAVDQNTPHWIDTLTGDQRDIYNRMKTGLEGAYNQPLNASTLAAIQGGGDLAKWYADQRAAYTPGVIDPNARAKYKQVLNEDFNGYGGQPGGKALAEEQMAGQYWGSGRYDNVMNAYDTQVNRPLNLYDINAYNQSYTNADAYANTSMDINNANVTNQLQARKAEDQNFQNALQFMGLETRVLDEGWINPETYANSFKKTPGTGGAWGTAGGIVGGLIGSYFGQPVLGYQAGSAIGGTQDKQPQQYSQHGAPPVGWEDKNQAQGNAGLNSWLSGLFGGMGTKTPTTNTTNIPEENPGGTNYSRYTALSQPTVSKGNMYDKWFDWDGRRY